MHIHSLLADFKIKLLSPTQKKKINKVKSTCTHTQNSCVEPKTSQKNV